MTWTFSLFFFFLRPGLSSISSIDFTMARGIPCVTVNLGDHDHSTFTFLPLSKGNSGSVDQQTLFHRSVCAYYLHKYLHDDQYFVLLVLPSPDNQQQQGPLENQIDYTETKASAKN
ncbi:uncharacterized protein BO87DRAFT_388186 [Aspergillus neoniger CBS 115656]|uniref:Secreted protein n=1 Tax=Aspergillus neoniger (strain CBS 115656) TaxID=1448310 RepID=A0A318YJ11_ASPNB|nr:hypothetical protein BO87DRAFT_388186 [Aspergillus neoniger CBS 115656]PYH32563.1 hypothetical protein BO87DRAFT_388186 [Aspergillus neoniger CBS 115656]